MTSQVGKQVGSLLALGAFMSRMGIQPNGVLFGTVIGFGAGNIAKSYGFDIVEATDKIHEPITPAPAIQQPSSK